MQSFVYHVPEGMDWESLLDLDDNCLAVSKQFGELGPRRRRGQCQGTYRWQGARSCSPSLRGGIAVDIVSTGE